MPPGKIRIVCISDTHNQAPGEGYTLPKGDVLIHAGDLTNQGGLTEIRKTARWLEQADFAVKLVVAGNHDLSLDPTYHLKYAEGWTVMPTEQDESRRIMRTIPGTTYLEHERCEVELHGRTLRVFGSPYTIDRGGQNWAFHYAEDTATSLWSAVPGDVDILITHSPPAGYVDSSHHWPKGGCLALAEKVKAAKPMIHVCGHHHEGRGVALLSWAGSNSGEHATLPWVDPGAEGKKMSRLNLTRDPGKASTAVINASIMKYSWTASKKKEYNKPIVIDVAGW